ncbi:hypothetical protein SAMN04487884_12712 [Butyrivibrio fibrisolvens]|uniref:Uncharacterized protein n=1 Tax=Butyrivibrio fibrisolvens TaxID=831 RepID=A0A1H9W4I2_BUTFI|nr:hypothetical protein [Butyrivibrio fibrisolvens]SES28788.1 hypothetical protein SAMN04487884_12712 [Butyrivibrio fibrisolvens]
MIYIITEDSKSGYDFWKIVFETFLDSDDFEIIVAAGNRFLQKCFNDTLDRCCDLQDSILLIFDNIDDTSNFNPGNLIEYCKESCEEKGVRFYFSDFYCFESIFLSYKEMLNMTSDCKPVIKDTIEYVNEAINQGFGYWDSTDDIVDNFLDQYGSEAKNREHFEAELLSIATRGIGFGQFHIEKSTFNKGKCWLYRCADIQSTMNSYVRDKDCDTRCRYTNKNMDTLAKLNDIFDNSILKESQIKGLIRRKESHDKNI